MTRRHAVLVLGDDVLGEEFAERRRLDHVVVDADEDQVFRLHDASRCFERSVQFRVLAEVSDGEAVVR